MRAVWAGLAALLVVVVLPSAASARSCGDVGLTVQYETQTPVVLDCSDPSPTLQMLVAPSHGTIGGSGGALTYTPDAGYRGPDYVEFRVMADLSLFHVTIDVVMPPPSCALGAFSTAAGRPYDLHLTCSGPVDSYTIDAPPLNGTLTGTAPDLTYTPAPGYSGSDSFTFHATNSAGDSGPASFAVTVLTPVPVCDDLPPAVPADRTTTLSLTCRDADAIEIVIDAEHGRAEVSGTTLSYTPQAGYSGPDQVLIRASNSFGARAKLIEFDVQAPRGGGAARCDDVAVDTAAATAVSVPLACSELTWSWSIVGAPAHGTLGAIGPLGTVTYTPDPGFHGVDRFMFRANGPGGGSATTTALVRVGGTDAAPVPAAAVAQPAPRCAGRVVTLRVGADARVVAGGKRVAVRNGRARIDLRGRATPTVTVRIAQRRADGRLARSTRVLSVCD
jgi:large repetitive protein